MRLVNLIAGSVLIMGTLLLPLAAVAEGSSITISEADYGEEWPLTVSEGVLGCFQRQITFTTLDGTIYGVNGTARSFGHADLDPIWKVDMQLIEAMVEAFDKTVEELMQDDPVRLSIEPIITDGLKLCG